MLLRVGMSTNKAYTPAMGCFIPIVLSFTQRKATANMLMREIWITATHQDLLHFLKLDINWSERSFVHAYVKG